MMSAEQVRIAASVALALVEGDEGLALAAIACDALALEASPGELSAVVDAMHAIDTGAARSVALSQGLRRRALKLQEARALQRWLDGPHAAG